MLLAVKLLFECSKSFFRDYKQSLFFYSVEQNENDLAKSEEQERLLAVYVFYGIIRS